MRKPRTPDTDEHTKSHTDPRVQLRAMQSYTFIYLKIYFINAMTPGREKEAVERQKMRQLILRGIIDPWSGDTRGSHPHQKMSDGQRR